MTTIIRRKLQFAGNSSYVVTLPKKWIETVGLAFKNSEVLITELDDGTLRISPANSDTITHHSGDQIITIGQNTTPNEVIRLILAGYLNSKSKIIIQKSKKINTISSNYIVSINKIVHKLWGAEIIEETNTHIIIHDALDASQIKFDDIIHKAWFTAKNMMERARELLYNKNFDAKIIVENSEDTLDKLYYLGLRQLYQATRNTLFAHDIGIIPAEIINYHLLIKNIERIGDHSYKIVNEYQRDKQYSVQLENLFVSVIEAADQSIQAFLSKDQTLAQKTIDIKTIIVNKLNKINIQRHELLISRSVLRLADYTSDIGELVLNRIVSDE